MGITEKKSLISFFFPLVFCVAFVLGQFGRIDLMGGAIYLHEVILLLGLIFNFRIFVSYVIPVRAPESRLIPDPFDCTQGKLVWYDRHKKLVVPVIYFVIAIVLSLLFSNGTKDARQLFLPVAYLFRFLLYSSLVFLVPLTGGARTWVKSLTAVGFLFTLAGFVQFFLYPDLRNIAYLGWDPHYMRFVSTLFDPNIAGFILISFLLITFLAFQTEPKYRKIISVVLACEVIAIILTFSRSTIVTLGVVMIAYSVVKKIWWPIFVAIGVGIISVIFMPLGSLSSPMRIVSALARVDNFSQGFQLFLSKPVTGVGWFMIPSFQSAMETTKAYARLDNSFLFVLASTGLVGFSAFLWMLARISMLVRRSYRIVSQRSTVIILGLVLLTLIIHSQFENIFFSAWGLTWLWVCVGLLVSLQKKES
jgi:O-antigen ligase